MNNSVLVLNQDYTPMSVCTLERAFLLVHLLKADLISASKKRVLRTVTRDYPYPSVIKINRYINLPYKGVVLSRVNIFKRDGHKCQYCGINRDLTLDHLIPRSKGGKTSWSNLVTACRRCNARKGDYSLEESGMKLKTIPIKPSYTMFLMGMKETVDEEWMPFLQSKAENSL
jgi:5-methylcytosine-specific restriction endonuclease McrA